MDFKSGDVLHKRTTGCALFVGPSDALVASRQGNGTVCVWDPATGATRQVIGSGGTVAAMCACSETGQLVIAQGAYSEEAFVTFYKSRLA